MADQNNNALVPHRPQATQREVDRHTVHMKAKEEVGEAVIENGTEIHDYASAKIIEAAQFDQLMLQAAQQNLNGTYPEIEEAIRQLGAAHRGFVFQTTAQIMASMLRQAESVPVNPETGFFAWLGDGVAEARDELKRLQSGG